MPFLYTVLLIASVFFYILYEHPFSFYLFAFLLVIPVVMFIMTLCTARKLKIGFTDKQSIVSRTAKLPIRLRVSNDSMLPCPNLLIEISYANKIDGKTNIVKINTPVYPHETQILTLSVSGIHCGTVDFNIKKCKVSDMLKIFTMKVKSKNNLVFDKNCTVTILPDYIPLENEIANYADMGLESDEYSKTQKGDDPSEIFDIRDYVEGDKLNRIHWKLTAKQDKTMVKDYSLPIANSIVLMIDLSKADGKADELTLFDSAVETAASVSEYLLENEVPHRTVFYDAEKQMSIEQNINDDESHSTMVGMLLQARLYDTKDAVLTDYIGTSESVKCGHLIYVSTGYSPNATELMSDADLAYKYTYLLMTDKGSQTALYDEFAELIPVYPGQLEGSIRELCL
ncbi:DUF58 domain-containing protein [Ruminococcus albus]|uniref:DUF58 domain-containing protein n=1 Tax=Ruminococcus albus TaxID=1264 RepID=A0A1I1N7G3_RUMAL|nr:DUF58 domain-containing protein [Ruminococcus albus]SFC93654.1 Protein of unknown function DUF58 [Ruminococcus albus]